MLSLRPLAIVLVLATALVACEQEPAPAGPPPPVPLSEHRVAALSGPPTKDVGEDCTTYGQAECTSGLCLHVAASANQAYRCSARCSQATDCPQNWDCLRQGLSGGELICVPRRTRAGEQ